MTTIVDAPRRVDGVRFLGEMEGSGYRVPPALVRRRDGQVLQLTPILYAVLQAVDGARTHTEIAEHVGVQTGRGLTGDDVETLISTKLRPLGLVRTADGEEPQLKRSNPLLALRPRIAITDPDTTRRLTAPFRVLFNPVLVAVVLAGFVAVVGWVFFERGLGASAYDAFERPHLLLLVFVVSVLSGGFHEFGHAAAARRGGASPGAMGAGLYLVWPAFYTDVTDSYRLDRKGRILTDLGGLYFNAIVVVLTFVCWWATSAEALLLLVATQVLQMAQQLLPLLRFDGYHLLADLAGVPDLYARIRPTLRGLLPHHWGSEDQRVLTPWARTLIAGWVLVTVPLLVMMFAGMIVVLPRLVGSGLQSARENAAAFSRALSQADVVDAAAAVFQLVAVALPVIGTALILGRIGWRFFGGLARWGAGSVTRRVLAAAVAAVTLFAVAWAWWPGPENYRPVQPTERDLIQLGAAAPTGATTQPKASALRSRLGSARPMVAAFEKGRALPTKAQPRLAMVLMPRDAASNADGAAAGEFVEPWVFPFDRPLPPEAGDNQALAVVTEDDSATYDLAFALVWADGEEVLNVNEAHAYASCTDCVAVAVAFQVVLIMDDADVIVPQNLAVAANYQCHRCITGAIASQLVLSLPGDPDQDQLRSLAEVWQRLIEFGRDIDSYSLAQIEERLDDYKEEIAQILQAAPVVERPEASPATPSPSSGPSTSSSPTPTASPTTADPATSPTPDATSPSPTPTPSPTAEPEATPSGSPQNSGGP